MSVSSSNTTVASVMVSLRLHMSLTVVVAGLLCSSVVTAFLTSRVEHHAEDDGPTAGDQASTVDRVEKSYHSIFKKLKKKFVPKKFDDQGLSTRVPVHYTPNSDPVTPRPDISEDCIKYWADIFQIFGHPVLNATTIKHDTLGLGRACGILKTFGLTLGGDDKNVSSNTNMTDDSGDQDRGPGPDTGRTVIEPSDGLLDKLGDLVGGQAKHDHGATDDPQKDMLDTIQDVINRKLNITSHGG
ncbi:hypothetical protein RRG08_007201 [Elysia crispata]|uniref:Uncharacterized protein n=1 Tax=Elysia crispata TaxID=231223 RepID=A0AAE1B3Q1_9GAST|nr:hypothetical protein RRG08_007201 [Elysia crispata]